MVKFHFVKPFFPPSPNPPTKKKVLPKVMGIVELMKKCQAILECMIYDNTFQLPSQTRIIIMSPALARGLISVPENSWQGNFVLAKCSDRISD
jgi:hypothetical protein